MNAQKSDRSHYPCCYNGLCRPLHSHSLQRTPPAPVLIKKACGIETASARPQADKVAKLTKEQLKQIAETKMPDLNAASLEAAMSMIAGTARSMGVTVEE